MHPQPTSEELKQFGTEFHLATLLQSAIQMRDTEGICNPAWEWHGYRENVYIRPCLSYVAGKVDMRWYIYHCINKTVILAKYLVTTVAWL